MTNVEIELAVIAAELGVMVPMWRRLARGIARIIAHFNIPDEEKETAR